MPAARPARPTPSLRHHATCALPHPALARGGAASDLGGSRRRVTRLGAVPVWGGTTPPGMARDAALPIPACPPCLCGPSHRPLGAHSTRVRRAPRSVVFRRAHASDRRARRSPRSLAPPSAHRRGHGPPGRR
eukprot:scaffold212291_cov29-Tisochrysis_lutea.AAC.5